MTTEESVGIRVYISNQKGFVGILRHKYTDFKVHEVDLSGQVARLTSFDIPKAVNENNNNPYIDGSTLEESTVDCIVAQYKSIIGSDDIATKASQLTIFLEQAQAFSTDASNPPPDPIELDPAPEKDQRRALHSIFKDISWLPPLQTSTAGSGETSIITLSLGGSGNRGKGQGVRRNDPNSNKRKRDFNDEWQGGSARYVRFVLYKENEDTQTALSVMSKALGVKTKCFSFAGTKDKRAVTVQFASAYRINPGRLSKINARLKGIRLGNFEYVDDEVKLGNLQGNKFNIILRGIDIHPNETSSGNESISGVEDLVSTAAAQLKQQGFINYFGLQRFGSGEVPTQSIGAALLKGQWSTAIDLLMQPSTTMRPELSEVLREYLQHRNAVNTLKQLPYRFVAGRAILSVLSKENSSNQYVNALMNIPRSLRTMYLHGYQSYLWNEATSERIVRHGADKVVKGDLILPRETMMNARKSKNQQFAASNQSKQDNDDDIAVINADGDGDCDIDMFAGDVVPHVVTEEEAEKGVYSIEDVVLPLPGSDIIWPDNDIKDVYTEVANRDGVCLCSNEHKVKEFSWRSLSGAYRHILYRPDDFEYELLRYDTRDIELASTDLDEMEKKGEIASSTHMDGKYVALRLSFTLPSSTYATMLIRELTKMSTALSFIKSVQHPE